MDKDEIVHLINELSKISPLKVEDMSAYKCYATKTEFVEK